MPHIAGVYFFISSLLGLYMSPDHCYSRLFDSKIFITIINNSIININLYIFSFIYCNFNSNNSKSNNNGSDFNFD